MIQIREMKWEDLSFADRLRRAEGWNQTHQDWMNLHSLGKGGCFIAGWNGKAVGTVTTISYGVGLGWIGMALVDSEFRRRGIGEALLQRAIQHLQDLKVRSIKLDATPVGKTLYDKLGFKEEFQLARYARPGVEFRPHKLKREKAYEVAEFGWSIRELDLRAFGARREIALARLAIVGQFERSERAFGIIRPGSNAAYLGPVVAESTPDAFEIIPKLIQNYSVIWDIPETNTAALEWAQQNGFTQKRTLTRMYLGENLKPKSPETIFAIAGPDLG